ncbi:MarR family winged helix-turn-helix transcriptional regulator [Jidongwangia harbinensis]|uniref:MarR family winged helix-turn-helix transcriptional regulator n=1 Tax=Jidongwangia harbinensis TaxID=2878561 RepID=UPI001CD997BF|nr:MarR family transcriptional regulator [Jidongwangia harbinensis]MCA2217619.1 MarR family transcriptional regulator [Jidongwangia harbinensis]
MPDAEVSASLLGRLLMQAGRVLDGPFGEVIDRYGLTRNAWWLLTELYGTRPEGLVTIGEHARRCGLAPSSATIAAEQLTIRKLARRRRPRDNRRIIYLTVTEPGVALVEAVRDELEASAARFYRLYDDEERRVLRDLLGRIVETANREPDGSVPEPGRL